MESIILLSLCYKTKAHCVVMRVCRHSVITFWKTLNPDYFRYKLEVTLLYLYSYLTIPVASPTISAAGVSSEGDFC